VVIGTNNLRGGLRARSGDVVPRKSRVARTCFLLAAHEAYLWYVSGSNYSDRACFIRKEAWCHWTLWFWIYKSISLCCLCPFFTWLLFKSTVNSTVSGHRQFRVNFRKRCLFFPNGIVFRYFDCPVIFSNLLAAWNVMLAVETWLIDVLITKCLTAPLHGKVKVPANYLHVTA